MSSDKDKISLFETLAKMKCHLFIFILLMIIFYLGSLLHLQQANMSLTADHQDYIWKQFLKIKKKMTQKNEYLGKLTEKVNAYESLGTISQFADLKKSEKMIDHRLSKKFNVLISKSILYGSYKIFEVDRKKDKKEIVTLVFFEDDKNITRSEMLQVFQRIILCLIEEGKFGCIRDHLHKDTDELQIVGGNELDPPLNERYKFCLKTLVKCHFLQKSDIEDFVKERDEKGLLMADEPVKMKWIVFYFERLLSHKLENKKYVLKEDFIQDKEAWEKRKNEATTLKAYKLAQNNIISFKNKEYNPDDLCSRIDFFEYVGNALLYLYDDQL